MYWIIFVIPLIYFIYIKATKNNNFFKKLGVKYENSWFLFGSTGIPVLVQRKALSDLLTKFYNKNSKEKLFGIFDLTNPVLIIRDANLIKKLFIKDFDYFTDRKADNIVNVNAILATTLSNLSGLEWREMRATLTPVFTSSKMKNMFQFIEHCANETINYLNINDSNRNNLNFADLYSRYFIDTVASCAFGINVNSHKVPNNYFIKVVNELLKGSLKLNLRTYFLCYFPRLADFFRIKILPDDVVYKFRFFINENMDMRIKENIYRPDLINILLQIRDNKLQYENKIVNDVETYYTINDDIVLPNLSKTLKTRWSEDDLVAPCIEFLQAGTDSIVSSLEHGTIELALNLDIQEKLYKEIIKTDGQLKGKPLNYETITSMKYLNMVILEILRKRITPGALPRVCTKDYLLVIDEFTKINIKKGTELWIPVNQLHHDPQYFPNPNEFNPERFSTENVDKIISGTYLPFGIGPRNCIASRFAVITLKAVLYCLVKEFKFEICKEKHVMLKQRPKS